MISQTPRSTRTHTLFPATTLFLSVFKDDAPVANDDSAGLTEGGSASVTFDVDTNDSNGADGFCSRSFTSLTGSYGTITVNLDGTQTYTLKIGRASRRERVCQYV